MESQLTIHNRYLEAEILARQGLRLPPITLTCLRTAGIYCQPSVSIEHQHLAKKYVLRGVESGGAVAEVGAYASFVDEQGNALPWLQRVVLSNDFQDAATRITSAVCCLGCRHCHLLGPKLIAPDRTENPNALDVTEERGVSVDAVAGGAA